MALARVIVRALARVPGADDLETIPNLWEPVPPNVIGSRPVVEAQLVSAAFNRGGRFDGARFWDELRRALPELNPLPPPFLTEATSIGRIVSHLVEERPAAPAPLERGLPFGALPLASEAGGRRQRSQPPERMQQAQQQQEAQPPSPQEQQQQQQQQQQQVPEDEGFRELERSGAPERIAPARSTPAPRFVNAWFESDVPVPPLVVGRWYTFCLDIGPLRDEAAAAAPFAEPDFGSHQVLSLRATFFSRELDVERADAVIQLPRAGRSSPARLRVRPRAAGACRLQIVLSLERELDVLQSLTVEIDARAGATAPEGAARGAGASP